MSPLSDDVVWLHAGLCIAHPFRRPLTLRSALWQYGDKKRDRRKEFFDWVKKNRHVSVRQLTDAGYQRVGGETAMLRSWRPGSGRPGGMGMVLWGIAPAEGSDHTTSRL